MKKLLPLLLLPALFMTSCATKQEVATGPKFSEEAKANIVIRYYSESISRVIKPLQTEGTFLSSFDKDGVISLAKQQPGRELAVVILIRYNNIDSVKQTWIERLNSLGYQRVVFLQGDGMKINGLAILDNPGHYSPSSEVAQHVGE